MPTHILSCNLSIAQNLKGDNHETLLFTQAKPREFHMILYNFTYSVFDISTKPYDGHNSYYFYGSWIMVQKAEQENKLTVLTSGNGKTYCLERDVFLVIQNDIAQLLDFNRGQFYGLDTIATRMVSLVLESGMEEAIAYIAQTYDVTEDRVRADVAGLLQNLESKQLLVATGKNSDRSLHLQYWMTRTGILTAACLWLLKVVSLILRKLLNNGQDPSSYMVELLLTLSWISFRLLGWSRTISLWQHWHRCVDASVETPVLGDVIQTVDRVVREAAASKLFLPMVCKERALVGYHLLRAFYGLPASLVVGIDRHPFQIHAWVECDGLVITDDPAHCKLFTPVVRYS